MLVKRQCRLMTWILFAGLILWKLWAEFLASYSWLSAIYKGALFKFAEEDFILAGRPNYDVLLRQSRVIIDEIGRLSKSQLSRNPALFQLLQQATLQLSARVNILDQLNSRRERRRIRIKSLSRKLQRQIINLQYPVHCQKMKIAFIENRKTCGFGCLCHHVAYRFGYSFALNRTLLIEPNDWGDIFQPITSCKKLTTSQNQEAVHLPVFTKHNGTHFDPPGLPDEWANTLKDIHGMPYVWFRGHLLSFFLRPASEKLKAAIMHAFREIWSAAEVDHSPYVGVHVRRTDKIELGEATFHLLSEYMVHVEHFFNLKEVEVQLETGDTTPPAWSKKRLVYLASDDASVLADARQSYTDYIFLGDQKQAKPWTDTTDDALFSIVSDILVLAKSDFLVCTASSNVCRLAYELMLAQQPANDDATFNMQSVDIMFENHGSRRRWWRIIADFKDYNLVLNELHSVTKNLSDGFLRTACALDGSCQERQLPAYLLQETILRYSKT
ncbi:hypothetical protein AAHC03_013752 [Spirometra sp. Aus1]